MNEKKKRLRKTNKINEKLTVIYFIYKMKVSH